MRLAWIDWLVVALYVVFALVVGIVLARRAGRDVDEYFLSGRKLPWWLAGTSMVATTFAADTPLVVSGWVRDFGIWKNWLWWCLAAGGMLTVFLFARWWRRGEVMTTAELAELRYGGRGARALRAFLGFYHAGFTNALVLCWVVLAAAKILDVLLGVDQVPAVIAASVIALTYSLLAGFWGVVVTDAVQFVIAMVGAIALATIAWGAVEGGAGIAAAVADGRIPIERLALFPAAGPGGPFDLSFWTVPVAAVAVYLGISWWAVDSVDGGGLVVQRIAAAKDERHGMLAALWYNVAHFALRPWPWFCVALASLIVLPHVEVHAPGDAVVRAVGVEAIVLELAGGAEHSASLGNEQDWLAVPAVAVGDEVAAGTLIARTDSERAYPTMMARFLPVGLLGLVVASLLAAFMSTIDTHVNLASSYFVNDLYRRFLAPNRKPKHYVSAARWASVGVMAIAATFAALADSISDLFLFFLAFLAGVGPIYILRWLWWRVRASTEITAMVASSVSATWLTYTDIEWSLGPLSSNGALEATGRTCLVVGFSMLCAGLSLAVTRAPAPETLVDFYRKVRPLGCWGPVRELAGVEAPREGLIALSGIVGGLALIYGTLFGIGQALVGTSGASLVCFSVATVGAVVVARATSRLR